MGIQREQIFQVADNLVDQGQNPTLAAVRRILGGGSFTTISEFMAEWRAQHQANSQPIRESAPRAVAERLQDIGNEIWAAALELANGRLAAEREALDAHRAEIEQRQVEVAEMADQMAEEIDGLKAKLAESEGRAGGLFAQSQELSEQNTHWQAESEKAKALSTETQKRVDDLRQLLEQSEQKSAEQIARLESERELLQQEATQAREETANVRGQLTSQEAHLRQQFERAESSHKEQTAKLKSELDQAQRQAGEAQEATASAREEAASLRSQIQAHGALTRKLEAECEKAKRQASEAREAAAGLRGKIEALETQNQTLLAKVAPAEVPPKKTPKPKSGHQAD